MPKLKELDHPGKADTTCKHQLVPVCMCVYIIHLESKTWKSVILKRPGDEKNSKLGVSFAI